MTGSSGSSSITQKKISRLVFKVDLELTKIDLLLFTELRELSLYQVRASVTRRIVY